MADTLDRIIVNGVEQAVEAGAPMTEPWSDERARREKTEENRQKLPPVDPPFPIPEGGGSGGGSGVLVVNATVDVEHAESETQFPLILDKTMAEMLAAENTVMSIDTGEGCYILTETYRVSADGAGIIMWAVEMGEMKFGAEAILDGGILSAVLSVSASGYTPPDETDEFTVYNTQYSGFYTASATHAVSNPADAKQAIFTFNFQYGTADERLSGTAEARLVSRTTSGDSTTLVYQAIVENNGKLWSITVTSAIDSGGTRTNTATVVGHPVGAFVLHGVTVDASGGTISESVADLTAAITARRRVLFTMTPTAGVSVDMEMVSKTITNGSPVCIASYVGDGILASLKVSEDNSSLVFSIESHPLSGS